MKAAKRFDCVSIKDELQAKLNQEYDGLDSEEIRRRALRKLAASDSPVAKLWRSLAKPTVGKP